MTGITDYYYAGDKFNVITVQYNRFFNVTWSHLGNILTNNGVVFVVCRLDQLRDVLRMTKSPDVLKLQDLVKMNSTYYLVVFSRYNVTLDTKLDYEDFLRMSTDLFVEFELFNVKNNSKFLE